MEDSNYLPQRTVFEHQKAPDMRLPESLIDRILRVLHRPANVARSALCPTNRFKCPPTLIGRFRSGSPGALWTRG
jgi:hypothetical protein